MKTFTVLTQFQTLELNAKNIASIINYMDDIGYKLLSNDIDIIGLKEYKII